MESCIRSQDKAVLPRHTGIIGTTGGGKSTTVATSIHRFQKAKIGSWSSLAVQLLAWCCEQLGHRPDVVGETCGHEGRSRATASFCQGAVWAT
jgi:DNA helicase HerA-like ATPase